MLNSLNPVALTCIALLFTSLAYLCASYVIEKRVRVVACLMIGIVVVLTHPARVSHALVFREGFTVDVGGVRNHVGVLSGLPRLS